MVWNSGTGNPRLSWKLAVNMRIVVLHCIIACSVYTIHSHCSACHLLLGNGRSKQFSCCCKVQRPVCHRDGEGNVLLCCYPVFLTNLYCAVHTCGTGIRGLMRGLVITKVHPGACSGQRQGWKTPQEAPLALHCFCVCTSRALLGDLLGVSRYVECDFLSACRFILEFS